MGLYMQLDFQNEVESFLTDTGMSATAFGLAAVKDSRFVHDLRKGRSCRMTTAEKVIKFINHYRRQGNNTRGRA